MGVSGYLKSIEHVWETLRIQADLPAGAATPLQSILCKARPCWSCTAPECLWAHQLKALWVLSIWQHMQVLQCAENTKEQHIGEQLPGRQRWVETFAFFYEHITAAGRSLFTVDKTAEENKGGEEACVCICKGVGIQRLFTAAASFIMGNFSRKSFPTCQKDHLKVFSCPKLCWAKQKSHYFFDQQFKVRLKMLRLFANWFSEEPKKVKGRACSELVVTMWWSTLPIRFQTKKWGFSLKTWQVTDFLNQVRELLFA